MKKNWFINKISDLFNEYDPQVVEAIFNGGDERQYDFVGKLVKECSKDGIQLQLDYLPRWQHTPIDKPYQLEIPVEGDDECDSYILGFFRSLDDAKIFTSHNNLKEPISRFGDITTERQKR